MARAIALGNAFLHSAPQLGTVFDFGSHKLLNVLHLRKKQRDENHFQNGGDRGSPLPLTSRVEFELPRRKEGRLEGEKSAERSKSVRN